MTKFTGEDREPPISTHNYALPYVVAKVGVYLQEVYGLYDTLVEAESAAKNRAALETDAYHTLEIRLLDPVDGLSDAIQSFRGEGKAKGRP